MRVLDVPAVDELGFRDVADPARAIDWLQVNFMIAPPCFGPTIDNGLVACVSCRKWVLHRQMIMQTTSARRFQHRDHANLLAKPLGCVAKHLLVQTIEEVP